jgi:hypothetical protein
MKKILVALLIFLGFIACNPEKKKVKFTQIKSEKEHIAHFSILDTTNANVNLSNCVSFYMNDSSIAKYHNNINLIGISFYIEKKDTLMLIAGFSTKPVIDPQSLKEKYSFRGWLFFNEIPVLFYDNEKTFGGKFYYVNKLLPDTIIIQHIKNQNVIPCWVYKIKSKNQLELIKKIPGYRVI